MAELRELADGRGDLLAEVAGVLEGASEGELNEPITRQSARLCRQAGADPEAHPGLDRGRPPSEGERRAPAALLDPHYRRPGVPALDA